MDKKISVIIPVYDDGFKYKGLLWLKNLINCLINQTEKNFEVIIIYDGNIEKYEEFCIDNRFTWYNMGERTSNYGNFCRDFGLKKAVGEYVCFIDQDNVIYPDYLKYLSELLDKNEEIDISLCKIYISWTGKSIILKTKIERGFINTLCFMSRRNILLKEGWWSRVNGSGDEFFVLNKLVKEGKHKSKLIDYDKPLGIWSGSRVLYDENLYPEFLNYKEICKFGSKKDSETRPRN